MKFIEVPCHVVDADIDYEALGITPDAEGVTQCMINVDQVAFVEKSDDGCHIQFTGGYVVSAAISYDELRLVLQRAGD